MIGVDTTFLVQLELVELPAHKAAHELLQRHQLGRKRILDTQLAAILWTAGVRQVFTANPADFKIFGFQLLPA